MFSINRTKNSIQRLDQKSREIGVIKECDTTDKTQWPEIIAWHQDTITRLKAAIQPYITEISKF